ncbi:MAG TPA: 4Fe-4S dicluster domain-containing protein, partial [Phycisphaerae bacterium]|nr:4Fe-4S dicluster domain-containing protein [Phycisphaerae bacterium]
HGKLVVESCNLCMDCIADCPQSVARFKIRKPAPAPAPIGLSRRGFLSATAAGVAVPVALRVSRASAVRQDAIPASVIRPPGAIRPPGKTDKPDEDFLNLCIRCGECMKVCTTNGLQPAGIDAGLAGIFAPVLVPRIGYCELACTLCGQVCPTGAIPLLARTQKPNVILGAASFDRMRCLPWAQNEECLVCEEHCPLDEKAIRFDIVDIDVGGEKTRLQRPWVDQSKCIGCGFCENKCPLDGDAGIHVYRSGKAPKESPNLPPLTQPRKN